MNVPWSTLRPNPRDQRERAAANTEFLGEGALNSTKDAEPEIVWDVGDFGKRMAFGGIVSTHCCTAILLVRCTVLSFAFVCDPLPAIVLVVLC